MTTVDFIHGLRFEELPAAVAAQAKRCGLDLLGVAASGVETDLSRLVRNHAVRHMGAGEGGRGARLLFDGRRASVPGAAYAGASTIDTFDAHDGHPLTKGHAGVAVLPAVLALCDGEGLNDGREFLASLVLGYEVAIRAGIALHGSVPDYHTSGAWNALGCAAVGARLLGLSPDATRHALGIAEYHGPRSQMMRCIDHPTMVKDGSGWGAFAGLSAAYLAADGFTGAPAVTIEASDQAGLWSDLGRRWRILELYFKPLPICRWAQPAIEAALSLLRAGRVDPDRIEAVEVETFDAAVRLDTRSPATTEEAQYALGFPLAAALARGRLTAGEIAGNGLRDARRFKPPSAYPPRRARGVHPKVPGRAHRGRRHPPRRRHDLGLRSDGGPWRSRRAAFRRGASREIPIARACPAERRSRRAGARGRAAGGLRHAR